MFFRFVFKTNVSKKKSEMKGKKAIRLYEFLVLNNPAFPGPLPKRFFMYLRNNRELGEVNFDEWENIPVFLLRYANGLFEYSEEAAFPPMFDNFVTGMSRSSMRIE